MEKVQQLVVHATTFRPKLIDAVSQIICVGPSQLVPKGNEKPNLRDARRYGFGIFLGQLGEPRIDRNVPSIVFKKIDLCLRHPYPSIHYKNIIIFIGPSQALSEAFIHSVLSNLRLSSLLPTLPSPSQSNFFSLNARRAKA